MSIFVHLNFFDPRKLCYKFFMACVRKIHFPMMIYSGGSNGRVMINFAAEFQGLNLSDSGDTDTLGPLPPGGIWGSSDGEYPLPPYDYFHNARSSTNTGSSKSPSPGESRRERERERDLTEI